MSPFWLGVLVGTLAVLLAQSIMVHTSRGFALGLSEWRNKQPLEPPKKD